MAQNRDAPAYQEYAASMLARTEFRAMSLEARGLLYTLRLECWVNGQLPSDPGLLARVLGLPAEAVRTALPEITPFFASCDAEIRCPELDDYKGHLQDRRNRQAAGGRAGAEKTNRGRATAAAGGPTSRPRVARESLVKLSSAKPSKDKSLEEEASRDAWRSAYDRASNGG